MDGGHSGSMCLASELCFVLLGHSLGGGGNGVRPGVNYNIFSLSTYVRVIGPRLRGYTSHDKISARTD